jgi:hypothetical protein
MQNTSRPDSYELRVREAAARRLAPELTGIELVRQVKQAELDRTAAGDAAAAIYRAEAEKRWLKARGFAYALKFGTFRCPVDGNTYAAAAALEHTPGSPDCLEARLERDRAQGDA